MFKVFFKPVSSSNNAYIKEIVESLELNGVEIVNEGIEKKSFKEYYIFLKFLLDREMGIVHLNWTENLTKKKNIKSRLRKFLVFLRVFIIHIFGKKVCWTMHNSIPHNCEDIEYAEKFVEKWSNLVDMIVVHSTSSKVLLLEKYKCDPNKILFVPHGSYKTGSVDLKLKSRLMKKYDITENDLVFLFFGVISEYKNLPQLLNVYSELDTKNTKLLIAGKFDKNISEKEKNYIQETSLKNANVTLDIRFIPEEEIATIFNLSDIVVLPYDKKSMQNSGAMIMALSYGKPVIIPEFGYVYDIKDKDFIKTYIDEKEGLREAIEYACKNSVEFKELGKQAKLFAKTELSWNKIAYEIVKKYKSICNVEREK